MSTVNAPYAETQGASAGQTIRRIIVYTLLFTLVVITANGLIGLLSLLLDPGTLLVGENTSSIAQAMAFTLIGGPLAAVLWWVVWRRLPDPAERASALWGLYVAAVLIVSLITFTTSLLAALSALVDGDWEGWNVAAGLVWAAVWVWHRWMWRHPSAGPLRLATVPAVLGGAFGLVVAVAGSVSALSIVFDTAIEGFSDIAAVGDPWWVAALQALIWAIGGGAVWAWHWYRERAGSTTTAFANVVLILLGVLGATLLTLAGIGTALFVTLRLLFDNTDPVSELLAPLGIAIAAAGVGAVVWVYHRGIALGRSASTREASVLATSGVALVAAASGLGVIVNSALGILAVPLAGDDTRTLLLGGVSALVVGGPVWWVTWRPLQPADAAEPGTGRRIYLIAVFGLSAVVALITLLVIGFRLFEFVLDPGDNVIDAIRAPIGLLTATALVAGYHFSVWRHDRAVAEASAPPPRQRTVGEVILVTGADPATLVPVIESVTGASVTVWPSASSVPHAPAAVDRSLPGSVSQGALPVPPPVEDLPVAGPPSPYATVATDTRSADHTSDAERLARALDGVTGRRVLVILAADGHLDVIPLAG